MIREGTRAGQGRAKQGRTRQGKAGQCRAMQGRTRQGKAGQCRANQGRARQGRTRQGRLAIRVTVSAKGHLNCREVGGGERERCQVGVDPGIFKGGVFLVYKKRYFKIPTFPWCIDFILKII